VRRRHAAGACWAVAWGLIDVNRGVLRAPKDVEERVALRIDFVAAVRGKGRERDGDNL
jgi:hypothetical protein